MSASEAEKIASDPIHDPKKTTYYLRPIRNYQDLLKNIIKTYKDIIYDLFWREVGYDIDSTIINWINEWKKLEVPIMFEKEQIIFLDELNDMLLQCKDNLINDLLGQIGNKVPELPSGEE